MTVLSSQRLPKCQGNFAVYVRESSPLRHLGRTGDRGTDGRYMRRNAAVFAPTHLLDTADVAA